MKQSNIFIMLILVLLSVMLSGNTFATIAVSSPPSLSLEPGDSARFEFQIQSTPGHGDVICEPSVKPDAVMQVEFDREEYPLVDLNADVPNIAYVTGKVSMSDTAVINEDYSSQICVSCEKASQDSGAATKKLFCAQSINANVVKEIVRENPKVHPKYNLPWTKIIIGLIIALIIAAIFFYHYYEKHKHERGVRVGTKEPGEIKPVAVKKKK